MHEEAAIVLTIVNGYDVWKCDFWNKMSCERSYIYFLSETLVWDFIIVIGKFLVVYLSDLLIEAKNRKSSS